MLITDIIYSHVEYMRYIPYLIKCIVNMYFKLLYL